MTPALVALATTFLLVTLAELPDKTTVTTLVLTTRFRSAAVITGACAAFALQSVIAVSFGGLLTLFPGWAVSCVVAALFVVGAAILLRQSSNAVEDTGADAMRNGPAPARFRSGALSSFGVLFAAEWADASQLAAASLAARFDQPIAVGLGTFAALATVTVLAVFVGGKLRDRIRPWLLQRCAGVVFAGFAAFEVIRIFV